MSKPRLEARAPVRHFTVVPAGQFKRSGGFSGLDEMIRENGGNPGKLLARFGIREADIADPESYVSYPAMVRLIEHCCDLFDDPHFGLALGARQSIEAIGPLASLLLASRTVREGLHLVGHYINVHAPGARMAIEETETNLKVSYAIRDRSVTNSRAGNEFVMASAQSILRAACGVNIEIAEVGLASAPPPAGSQMVEQHFGAPIVYHRPISYLAIPMTLLEQEVDSGNPVLLKFVRMQCEALCPDDSDDVGAVVASEVRRLLPSGECSLDAIAEQLGMHPRSLQNRLNHQRLEFRTIVREQRHTLAEAYLRHTATPLADIALLLGYSDQASFTRAFRKWSGTSPRRSRVASKAIPGHS